MQNEMKRLIVLFGVITLFGCGMLTTGRSPAVNVSNSVEEVIEAKEDEAVTEVRDHVSEFNAEDLYRSRAEKLRRNSRIAHGVQQEEAPVEDIISEVPVFEKSIVEIIQVVENGKVIAEKQVK